MEPILLSLERLTFYDAFFANIIFLLTGEIKNEDNFFLGGGEGAGGRGQGQARYIMGDVEVTNGPTTDSYLQLWKGKTTEKNISALLTYYLCSWLSQENWPFSTMSLSLDLFPKKSARSVARIHSFM